MNYTIPQAGYYRVSSSFTKVIPTGKMIWQDNWDRKWWQFWKPKKIEVPEYKFESVQEGTEIKLFKKGEEVFSENGIVRL